jgi:hypothetical protein
MLRSDLPISLRFNVFETLGTRVDGGMNIATGATDIGSFAIPFKCAVLEAGVIVKTAIDASAVVKFDHRITAGSDTGRGDGNIAALTLTATAQGKQMYDLVAQGSILNPGTETVVQVTTAPAVTGVVEPYMLVQYIPEIRSNMSALLETA